MLVFPCGCVDTLIMFISVSACTTLIGNPLCQYSTGQGFCQKANMALEPPVNTSTLRVNVEWQKCLPMRKILEVNHYMFFFWGGGGGRKRRGWFCWTKKPNENDQTIQKWLEMIYIESQGVGGMMEINAHRKRSDIQIDLTIKHISKKKNWMISHQQNNVASPMMAKMYIIHWGSEISL